MTSNNDKKLGNPRDTVRTVEAYSAFIAQQLASNEEIKQGLNSGRFRRPASMVNLIFMQCLTVAQMMYCRGDDLESIQQPILEAIKVALELKETSSVQSVYPDVVNISSLALLLKMPEKTFHDLKRIVDRDEERDQVLDFMISARVPYTEGEAGGSAIFTSNALNKTIDCSQQKLTDCQQHLKDYLNNEWHTVQLEGPDFKHRSNPDLPYSGLYCYSVAAIACILKLDDAQLRTSEYYPADLADYARKSSS